MREINTDHMVNYISNIGYIIVLYKYIKIISLANS